jgi:hypothetical protein
MPRRRRLALGLVMAAMVAVELLGVSPGVVLGAGSSHVKVAIVVGPVGSMTDYYRGLADEAAAVARRASDQVVTVYSPNATWPKVRRALQGASIVVYLGHGNGWPSPYRDALYPPTQNGLGLNPVAGVDDDTHQYFGEQYLATSVDLAPGAVVILSHLCYASGNPEPGGPNPALSVARLRADNYAAGWLAAGAAGVIAEAHGGPAYYVDALFHRSATLERIWRDAPTFHDHVLEFGSARVADAQVMLDPDRARQGYFRSLVTQPGAQAADVLNGVDRPGSPAGNGAPDVERVSLASQGATFGTPALAGLTVGGSRTSLTLPLPGTTHDLLPKDAALGVRWDLLLADGPDPVSSTPPGLASGSGAPAAPDPSTQPAPSSDPTNPAATPDPAAPAPAVAGPEPASEPPGIQLVAPELPGVVVVAESTKVKATRMTVPVTLPLRPGLYRLSTSLHDRDGVAFDAATQELIPALLVRITGPLWATYASADSISATAGAPLTVPIRVANTGSQSWSGSSLDTPEGTVASALERRPARLVARWVTLDRTADGPFLASEVNGPPVYLTPGASVVLSFEMVAPTEPGHYLLVVDVVLSDRGSLTANGVPPGLIRVSVEPSPTVSVPVGPRD